MNLFDRLVEQWPQRTIVPNLAESWQISDDGLRYEFRLREGLTWSDGNPLTAPGGPGITPGTTGAAPANTFGLQYRELIALVNAQRDLSAGFTTVVDLMTHGGWYGTVDLRNAIDSGLVQGPRMQVAGPGIVATNRANIAFPLINEAPIANLGAQVANGFPAAQYLLELGEDDARALVHRAPRSGQGDAVDPFRALGQLVQPVFDSGESLF
jgi:hypothetical protein